MTESFLSGTSEAVNRFSVPGGFARGPAGLGGLFSALGLAGRILSARFRLKTDVLYFVPAGPNRRALLSDCVTLILVRPFFSKTVFHLHASGMAEFYGTLPGVLKGLFRRAYTQPDGAISRSKAGLRDAEFLEAKHTAVVPNGIPDIWADRYPRDRVDVPTIVFLGTVCEAEGVGILLEACKMLRERGHTFRCKIGGPPTSEGELRALKERAADLGTSVEFVGPLSRQDRWEFFADAEILCVPAPRSSDSLEWVVLEAIMTGMPVVASQTGALPEILADAKSGFLAPPNDAKGTADRLAKLLRDPILRQVVGSAARNRYLEHFQEDVFRQKLEDAILLTCDADTSKT